MAVMAVMLARDLHMHLAVAQKLSQVQGEMHPGVLSMKESIDAKVAVRLISHLAMETMVTQTTKELSQCSGTKMYSDVT